jgi:histone acetyltransferase
MTADEDDTKMEEHSAEQKEVIEVNGDSQPDAPDNLGGEGSGVDDVDDNTKKRKSDDLVDSSEEKSIEKKHVVYDETAEQPLKKQKLLEEKETADGKPPNDEETKQETNSANVEEGNEMDIDQADENATKATNKNSPGQIETKKLGDGKSPNDEIKADDASPEDGNQRIDSTAAGTEQKQSNEKRATQEESKPAAPKGNPYESLKYMMVTNDGKPESLIKLVALKSLFSKQLPKMPRAYIARLVFDRRHVSLAILNENPATKDTDEEVIGAICYRPFYDMKFAEIAFCAVNASHQVKGYGTKLMNLVKQEGARTGIEYFITYADNYAIGYFKKQGFSKSISMPKGRYQGLIKDYDGGTMMECYVHPSLDFTRIPEMLAAQREFILSRIRLKAQSTKVYPPLPKDWSPSLEGVSRGNEAAARALAIPGMVEAGWTMADLMSATGQGKDLDRAKNALKSELLSIVRKVEEQQFSWPFREPVDTTEVKDYLEIIKEPIDLSTIDKRIRKGDHYKSKKMLYADLMLMVNNCKLYNEEGSTYMQCARNLETYLKGMFASM